MTKELSLALGAIRQIADKLDNFEERIGKLEKK
jgi:hypothetical protein